MNIPDKTQTLKSHELKTGRGDIEEMDRWRTDRRSLVLDTRASQYLGRLLCSGPPPASAENSPWKLSDSFTQSRERPGPGSPRPPRQTPRRRTRSSSSQRRRPVSAGPLLDESYAETASFIQSRYHGINQVKRLPLTTNFVPKFL